MIFSLGSLQLKSNLFLSPLAGYTNLPFRLVIREIGGVDLCTTDLVNARSLLEQNSKALKLIESNEQDSPLSVQLFGWILYLVITHWPFPQEPTRPLHSQAFAPVGDARSSVQLFSPSFE